jgi:hypothetical protein
VNFCTRTIDPETGAAPLEETQQALKARETLPGEEISTMLHSSLAADLACGMAKTRAAAGGIEWALHRKLRLRGGLWGVLGAGLLFLVYLGLVSAANSPAHAIGEFLRLWYWMVPLVAGFGVQVGLFAYARGAAHSGAGAHATGLAASGGAGTISMAACCAHHVTDVLPLVGLAGMGLFLSDYQSLFLLVGVLVAVAKSRAGCDRSGTAHPRDCGAGGDLLTNP